MPKFHVRDTFAIEGRQLYVLAGTVVGGEIRQGMAVDVPLNSSPPLPSIIHSIEFARHTSGHEDVCLCIKYKDQDELSIWRGLKIKDEILNVR